MSFLTYNILNGDTGNNITYCDAEQKKSIKDYFYFKNGRYQELGPELQFTKKIKLTSRFKCLNAFEYRYSQCLTFYVLKVREYDSNKTFYFQFFKHNYRVYTKEEIAKDNELRNVYSRASDIAFLSDVDIYKIDLKDCELLSVNHYECFNNTQNFIKDFNSIMENINDVKITDMTIIGTPFHQTFPCVLENSFKNYNYLATIFNFEPSGSYEITDFEVRQSEFNKNIYFVENNALKDLFMNKILTDNDVQRNVASFDIESEVVSSREINDEKNIITHLGFEYYTGNKETSFVTCLINLDFYLRTRLIEEGKERLIKHTDKDDLYNLIRAKDYSREVKEFFEEESAKLVIYKKNIIPTVRQNKFVFCTEVQIVENFVKLAAKLTELDFILSFNGHSYDYQQMARRLSYLKKRTIVKTMKFSSLYHETPNRFFENANETIGYNIVNMDLNQTYYSVDVCNYVIKQKSKMPSFTLKEVSKTFFKIPGIVQFVSGKKDHSKIILLRDYKDLIDVELDEGKLKIAQDEYDKQLHLFITVLLSSNYIYINDIAYKITTKSGFIKEDQSIYDVDINEVMNKTIICNGTVRRLEADIKIEVVNKNDLKTTFDWDKYRDYIDVISLSKDDVEISSTNLKQNTFEIASYCIHDTLLCRYLMKELNIFKNNDFLSFIYYLPQSQAFMFSNSTNFLGWLFKTCYTRKAFLAKKSKIRTSEYSGGKVFEPAEHFVKEPVKCFDFEGLYPSLMINYNYSPDTLVQVLNPRDEIEFALYSAFVKKKFDPKLYSIVYNKNPPTFTILVYTKIYKDGTTRVGLLSYLLSELKKERNKYKQLKKKYSKENNEFQTENCDMLQNLIKLLMNSVYGLLGSNFHNISCKFTSQAITLTGANAITFLGNYFNGAILEDNKLKITSDIDYNPITSSMIDVKKIYDLDYGCTEKTQLKLIYGDTDSIMITNKGINQLPDIIDQPEDIYRRRTYYLSSRLGNAVAKLINSELLQGNLNMEFENILFDFILLAKKKYRSEAVAPLNDGVLLSQEEIDRLEIKCKTANKGISLNRRDNCNFQKKHITRLFKMVHEKVTELRFTENVIEYETMANQIVEFVHNIRAECISDYLNDKTRLADFIITQSYKANYKSADNTTDALVKKYNTTARERIEKGDRFKFVYRQTFPDTELTKKDFITSFDLQTFLRSINWTMLVKDLNTYRIIVNEINDLDFNKRERIAFEIYLDKLRKDISTIFSDTPTIYRAMVYDEKKFCNKIR